MLAMDLIVTVDGMPAHLAGSLGRPTWMLLPYAGDWRWMRDRSDSPWYPTMRIFRQPTPGDWQTPVNEMVRLLSERSTA
jgi:ADP-heptose:LPS heptosyltransferase